MPIIKPTKHTAPVYYPQSDYKIVKYLDLTRFISLLQRQSLFFCRLDKLEDKFEGTTAKPNFDYRINLYEHLRENNFFKVTLSDEDITQKVKEQYEFQKKKKAINCVNCWNKKNNESAALWKIYSDFSKGIMIKSSISKLIKSLEVSTESMSLSEIRYIDYSQELMPDGNSMYPIIHKHIAYSYEEEVRLIFEKTPETGWEYDWSKEEVPEGIYIKANVSDLIEEIVVGPYSPQWFFKLVQDISEKYQLNKPINKSQLSVDEQ
jgi:hypothetical protein